MAMTFETFDISPEMEDLLMGNLRIPRQEYEALTALESHVRKVAAKRSPIDRRCLSSLLERVRESRSL